MDFFMVANEFVASVARIDVDQTSDCSPHKAVELVFSVAKENKYIEQLLQPMKLPVRAVVGPRNCPSAEQQFEKHMLEQQIAMLSELVEEDSDSVLQVRLDALWHRMATSMWQELQLVTGVQAKGPGPGAMPRVRKVPPLEDQKLGRARDDLCDGSCTESTTLWPLCGACWTSHTCGLTLRRSWGRSKSKRRSLMKGLEEHTTSCFGCCKCFEMCKSPLSGMKLGEAMKA